jgi:hypothetical protein
MTEDTDGRDSERSMQRYLTAKRTVDDRALDSDALEAFETALPDRARIIEVAAGVGTMLHRLLEWETLPARTTYTMLDIDAANVAASRRRLPSVARSLGYDVSTAAIPGELARDEEASFALSLRRHDREVTVQAAVADVFDLTARLAGERTWDVVVASAFLDIAPGADAVESLFRLAPGGAFYFPITFDGATRFHPSGPDRAFERRLERRWHAGMRSGEDPNDPRAGSRLPDWVRAAGGSVTAAGGSTWVVRPDPCGSGYPDDEEYFLRHVLGFVEGSLLDDDELCADRVRSWLARRRRQLDAGDLRYVAHNVDVAGRIEPSAQPDGSQNRT